MAGKTTDILNICGSVSLNVSDKPKGPTPVCQPGSL